MDAILPTQPENYWKLLKRSLYLYKISFKKVILLAALLSIVTFIPRLLTYLVGYNIFENVTTFSVHQLWLAIINVFSFIFFIGIVWHMHCIIINKHEPLIEDFSVGLKKAIAVFIAATIQGILVLALAALLIASQILVHQYHEWLFTNLFGVIVLCGIFIAELFLLFYVSALFIFIVPLIAIENKGILSALERSVVLVWNHWWRTISLQMTPWICFAVFLSFIRYVLDIDIHIYFVSVGWHPLLITIVQMVIFAIFIPWVGATLLVQLKDLELRKNIST